MTAPAAATEKRTASPHRADDAVLLSDFARHDDERAFTRVVERHATLVLAAASRRATGGVDPQDVAQAALIMLARRPRAAARSARRTGGSVSPWLLKCVRYAAANAVRSASRRDRHEARAVEPRASRDPSEVLAWREIARHLDDAVLSLSPADRTAVVLRYFDDRSVADIAVALDVSHDAAKQRLSRATRRLRDKLARRGVTVPTATLASLLAAHASAVPTSVSAAALATAALSPAAGTAGLTLATGGLAMMKLVTLKLAVTAAAVIVAGSLVVGGALAQDGRRSNSQDAAPGVARPSTPLASRPATEDESAGTARAKRFVLPSVDLENAIDGDGDLEDSAAMLDLDGAGGVVTVPVGLADEALIRLAGDAGVELAAGLMGPAAGEGALGLVVVGDVDLARVSEKVWEMPDAESVVAALRAADRYATARMIPGKPFKGLNTRGHVPTPMTFAFRTQAGVVGMIRLDAVRFDEPGRSIAGSLKLLTPPTVTSSTSTTADLRQTLLRQQEELAELTLERAKEALKIATLKHGLGQVPSEDVGEAELAVKRAEVALTQARLARTQETKLAETAKRDAAAH